jgi:pimeloyl-ACP methyl ester carboxylesterase
VACQTSHGPPAWCDETAEALPRAKLVRLNRIGHSNILEAPEIVIPPMIDSSKPTSNRGSF